MRLHKPAAEIVHRGLLRTSAKSGGGGDGCATTGGGVRVCRASSTKTRLVPPNASPTHDPLLGVPRVPREHHDQCAETWTTMD